MTIPADLKYTKEHEWVRIEGDTATFGISDHAQEALGDIVFVELPEIGRELAPGDAFAVVESVKAVSDVYAPVGGEIIEVNEALEGEPEKINTDSYGAGWIVRVKINGGSGELLDAEAYATFLKE
ncbi:MAG: glycine cleavage system protein H [Zetaproteobacteria bacterium CG12_big_fil_rev_8_21_14_0_65_55_1124]|nr:MAG: glycine cleavage system protein H [Zetaproteobacteria bacterium CG1_02_55_237]PIS19787.1 MAG: glycine cleavage system protein H [Zetaproteobacteria bacterium CG08_land_8_20_14_0_20_55_17]PIW42822.1 MAG: glycine cleavage system protein H [Zetaproteobacteria bacterium CG12_big_fil_rev_8_21_14_0_65_55_1124]PIY51634.1 MAG: glycine cleavage system protein H [Zetaproteobacteria bacterium CG_4_10_14_0_8_um_filter_55_43]PIZ39807.1 MAG: glycine cleavage system protein H [Zetaproteobacteria bacte